VVYAEPLPVNEILLPPHKWSRADLVGALRSLGAAFARHARKPYVLKLTSWNTLCCDIVAEAFPDSPWVLCRRDPVEVAVSLLASPAGWIWDGEAPAAPFLKLIDPEAAARSREHYVARLFGAFCAAARRLDPARGMLVDYPALPDAAWERVAPHFGLAIDASLRARMQAAVARNAKSPIERPVAFTADTVAKQSAASDALRDLIERYARPELASLQALHAGTTMKQPGSVLPATSGD
jgi:hypothetical protein